jgi:hypothetical protein
MTEIVSPLRDRELVRLLAGEPELLAIADALVETQRGRKSPRATSRRWRPLLVAAVVTAALAGAGVAIAESLGAFDGISAAQRPQTSADILDPSVVARLQSNCDNTGALPTMYMPQCHLLFDSSRLVSQLPDGRNVYVITDSRGDLCVLLPNVMMGCSPSVTPSDAASGQAHSPSSPLSRSNPITVASFGDSLDTPRIIYGVALDGVTAVSFESAGSEVTVPVKDNVWAYEQPSASTPDPNPITAHFADGTTVTIRS